MLNEKNIKIEELCRDQDKELRGELNSFSLEALALKITKLVKETHLEGYNVKLGRRLQFILQITIMLNIDSGSRRCPVFGF